MCKFRLNNAGTNASSATVCKSAPLLRNGTTLRQKLVERLNIGWNREVRKGEKDVREDRLYKLPKTA